jgi:CRP/FNR family cyclic AMP-dependent transcriptional regulator
MAKSIKSPPSQAPPAGDLHPRLPAARPFVRGEPCRHRSEAVFGTLAKTAREEIEAITTRVTYPKGAALFNQGETARGIFILGGRVKLLSTSERGRISIVRIAESGEVLALSKALLGDRHGATGEVLEACEITFIGRDDLLQFLQRNGDAALSVAQELASNCDCDSLAALNGQPSDSAQAKIVRLLLEWATNSTPDETFPLRLTHEEMSQLIGTSRETVTRIIGTLKRQRHVEVKQGRIRLLNRAALETIAKS